MPPATRQPRGPRDTTLRIGFVGTLVWHKGVHVLLDAVRQLPPTAWELNIFGSTETFPDYVAELPRAAAGLPVAFTGAFDRERAADVYAQMDVLVVPSLWLENSPLVIHEAFMAGVPVVAARMGGIADLVTDGVERIALRSRRHRMRSPGALRRLIDNPAFWLNWPRGRPRVKSIAEDAAEWDAAYADVRGQARGSGRGLMSAACAGLGRDSDAQRRGDAAGLARRAAAHSGPDCRFEIIAVDSGSTDGTTRTARAACAPADQHPARRIRSRADPEPRHRTGARRARRPAGAGRDSGIGRLARAR